MIFIGADRRIVGIVENAEPRTLSARRVDASRSTSWRSTGGLSAKLGIHRRRSASTSAASPAPERLDARGRSKSSCAQPMLATLANAPLRDPRLVYERKYDGIRAIIAGAAAARRAPRSRIASRLGNDKTAQFPEVGGGARAWARAQRSGVVSRRRDRRARRRGDAARLPAHPGAHSSHGRRRRGAARGEQPVAYVRVRSAARRATTLRRCRWSSAAAARGGARRGRARRALRLSRRWRGDGTALMAQALADGWEGLIAKDARSVYRSGERTSEWRKLKLVKRQEMVVGGWTEPRGSRASWARCCWARAGGRLALRRPRRRRLHREGLGARRARSSRAREVDDARSRDAAGQRQAALGAPRAGRRGAVRRLDDDGILRHAVFLGLRDDVVPRRSLNDEDEAARRAPAAPPADAAHTPATSRTLGGARGAAARAGGGTLESAGGVARAQQPRESHSGPRSASPRASSCATTSRSRPSCCRCCATGRWSCAASPTASTGSAFYQQRAPDDGAARRARRARRPATRRCRRA